MAEGESAIQGRSYAFEQDFVIERLGKKVHRTRSQRLHAHMFVAVRGNEAVSYTHLTLPTIYSV